MNRQGLDRHLMRLQQQGKTVLMRDDAINVQPVGAGASAERARIQARKDASLDIAGQSRHFVYFDHSWKGD